MPIAMTGHVLFTSIDPRYPATTSSLVIANVIREEIGFEGLLMTDDICMSALEGSPIERVQAALFAGCDLVLHCNGELEEMRGISHRVGPMEQPTWKRAMKAMEFLQKKVSPLDLAAAKQELTALLV